MGFLKIEYPKPKIAPAIAASITLFFLDKRYTYHSFAFTRG